MVEETVTLIQKYMLEMVKKPPTVRPENVDEDACWHALDWLRDNGYVEGSGEDVLACKLTAKGESELNRFF